MSGFTGGIVSDLILRVNVSAQGRFGGGGFSFCWAREDRSVVEGVGVKCRVVVVEETEGAEGGGGAGRVERVLGEEIEPGVRFEIGDGVVVGGEGRVLRLTPVLPQTAHASTANGNESASCIYIGWESLPFKGKSVVTFECERTFVCGGDEDDDGGKEFKVLEKQGETLGSNIWDSAIVTAGVLDEMTAGLITISEKSKVLDLSAGCGYLPLRLLHSHGIRIDSCEAKGKTLDLLRENCKRAGLEGDKVFACDWGEEIKRGAYDVVLLSDCLYDVSRLGLLKKTLESCCDEKTVIVLVQKIRGGERDVVRVVKEGWGRDGWEVELGSERFENGGNVWCARMRMKKMI
ncbi:hypothetical protein TrVE_jg6017 [Triparma verrucosa]|uniref:Uncharacterized protein n=1 Tax=Triparma verrucosa TaxID=1606542 RepID=A0A9W7FLM8_9STRA|nr:hypothetical protein TrVE_jg6017 [Triparma verrucosa]